MKAAVARLVPKREIQPEKPERESVIRRSPLNWGPEQQNLWLLKNWPVDPKPFIMSPRIVFSRFAAPAGTLQIYSMNPDGTNQVNISNSTYQDETPVINPANGDVVFSRGANGETGSLGLYVMKPDGSAQRQLTVPPPNMWDCQPAFNKNGSRIAFTRFYQIWTANADGTNQKPVMDYTQLPGLDHAPTWNPDGKELAFWREKGGMSTIMRVSLAPGSQPTQITQPSATTYDGWPSWSPDGQRIAFWRNEVGQMAIWTISPDGQGLTNVSQPDSSHGVEDMIPSWSPLKSMENKIVFSRTLYINWDIYSINADGTGLQQLTSGTDGHNNFYANWQVYT